MNRNRRKKLFTVLFILIGMAGASFLALRAFNENLLYFYSPTQVVSGEAPATRGFRIGGLVVDGSVSREADGLIVRFILTDTLHEVPVIFDGILPDLFREGQGVVANGHMRQDGIFEASEVLAKHDENYMPPEVAEALNAAGAKKYLQK